MIHKRSHNYNDIEAAIKGSIILGTKMKKALQYKKGIRYETQIIMCEDGSCNLEIEVHGEQ